MKKLFYMFIVGAILVSCGNRVKETVSTVAITTRGTDQIDHVEVLYFHGAKRCVTCRAIETHTKALLDSLYSKELASGLMIYKIIDISQKENESIADKYEVTWSSLFVNGWKNGKENINDMTDFSFASAKSDPDTFKKGIESKIDELLK